MKAQVLMWNDTPIACSTSSTAVADMEYAREDFAQSNDYTYHGGNLYLDSDEQRVYLTIYQVRSPE